MEKIRERLNEFLAVVDLSKRKFQEDIGVSPAYFANAVNNISPRVIQRIKKAHPELNVEWLQTGQGNMFAEGFENNTINIDVSEDNSVHGDNSVGGKNNKITRKGDDKLIDVILSQQQSLAKSQEQIDRLLQLFESKFAENK